jgi:predicted MFS family arabinose efflux permease
MADAGGAVAALGAGFALAAPAHGRLLDRVGARRVLPLVTAVHVGALVAGGLTGTAAAGLALLAGATTPPLSALMRASWIDRVGDEDERAFVLGIEAVAVEASFVVGPAAVSLLLLVADPAAALLVLAGMTAVGALAFVAAAPAAPSAPVPVGAAGPLRSAGVRTLLAATTAFGVAEGIVQVAVVGATGQHLAGVLLTTAAAASVGGGLLYVRWRRGDAVLDFSAAHLAMAAALVLAAGAAGSDAALAVSLLGLGIVGSPVPVTNSRLLARVTARRHATEAGTWLVVAVVVGGAVGSGAGGWIVEHVGAPPALLIGAVAVAVGGGIAWWRRSSLR